MKANGRRRWRKWLASQRRRGYEPAAIWGRDKQRVGIARRHQGQGWAGWDLPTADGLPALTPRPFSPRSLVGMTMGARKRVAWVIARLLLAEDCEGGEVPPPLLVRYRRIDCGLKYRIGERLRPCPGCCACKSKPVTQRLLKRAGHPLYAKLVKPGEAWVCGALIMTEVWSSPGPIHTTLKHCDGSGVLPANR